MRSIARAFRVCAVFKYVLLLLLFGVGKWQQLKCRSQWEIQQTAHVLGITWRTLYNCTSWSLKYASPDVLFETENCTWTLCNRILANKNVWQMLSDKRMYENDDE